MVCFLIFSEFYTFFFSEFFQNIEIDLIFCLLICGAVEKNCSLDRNLHCSSSLELGQTSILAWGNSTGEVPLVLIHRADDSYSIVVSYLGLVEDKNHISNFRFSGLAVPTSVLHQPRVSCQHIHELFPELSLDVVE